MFEEINLGLYLSGVGIAIAAFILLILFEIIKCRAEKQKSSGQNPFFLIGSILLITGWVLAAFACKRSTQLVLLFGIIILAVGLFLYFLVLRETSADHTYTQKGQEKKVYTDGCYGIIRHPGLWCFLIVSIGAELIVPALLPGNVLFVILNTIYIFLQDKIFFPIYLQGYTEYRKNVPFCIPDWDKLRTKRSV